jgi:hypothetical protein
LSKTELQLAVHEAATFGYPRVRVF